MAPESTARTKEDREEFLRRVDVRNINWQYLYDEFLHFHSINLEWIFVQITFLAYRALTSRQQRFKLSFDVKRIIKAKIQYTSFPVACAFGLRCYETRDSVTGDWGEYCYGDGEYDRQQLGFMLYLCGVDDVKMCSVWCQITSELADTVIAEPVTSIEVLIQRYHTVTHVVANSTMITSQTAVSLVALRLANLRYINIFNNNNNDTSIISHMLYLFHYD